MDSAKMEVIQKMPRPHNVPELLRVLGMQNIVQKLVPDLLNRRGLYETAAEGHTVDMGGRHNTARFFS